MTDRKGVLPSHYESKLVTSACSGVSLVPSAWFRYSTLERAKAIIHSRWRASNRSLQRESAPRNTLSRTQSLPDGRALTGRPHAARSQHPGTRGKVHGDVMSTHYSLTDYLNEMRIEDKIK